MPATAPAPADEAQIVARRSEIDPGTDYVAPSGALETRLAAMWQTALNIDQVGRNDSFFELGGDSLQAISLILRVEKELGFLLAPSIIIDHPTLRQLAALLASDTKPDAARILVSLQPEGAKPPLFFVHEASGNVFSYQALVRHMGRSRQVYGIIYPGQDQDPIPALSVPQMAAIYVAAIKSMQAKGPYLLAGYSFGGTVAFEIARQLRDQGDEIGLLVLIDAGNRDGLVHGPQRFVRKLAHHLAVMSDESPSRWPGIIWGALRKEMEQIGLDPLARLRRERKDSLVPKKLQVLIGDTLMGAHADYAPQSFDGKVKLLRCSQGIGARYGRRYLGWAEYVKGGLDVVDLPTDHYAALSEPTVALVAAHLRQWLDQVFKE
jgi:thioesterase domain-containing protein/acyl carrier protein